MWELGAEVLKPSGSFVSVGKRGLMPVIGESGTECPLFPL